MKKILLTTCLLVAGCSSHHHSILVTSSPSNQPFEVEVLDHNNKSLPLLNKPFLPGEKLPVINAPIKSEQDYSMKTPYEVVVDGEAERVLVRMGPNRKMVFLNHNKTVEYYCEPLLGLTISKKVTDSLEKKTVHFDQ